LWGSIQVNAQEAALACYIENCFKSKVQMKWDILCIWFSTAETSSKMRVMMDWYGPIHSMSRILMV
jgi:hypothetical protein